MRLARNFRNERFTVTLDHIMLSRRMNVEWDGSEFGAPAIDPKRPYGNSDVLGDIAEILGWKQREESLSEEQETRAHQLHGEMEIALEILLRTGGLTPGDYVASDYQRDWRRA